MYIVLLVPASELLSDFGFNNTRLHDLVFVGFVLIGSLAAAVPSAPIYARNASEEFDLRSITLSRNLAWHLCGSFSCAVLDVPLDYSKPHGNRALVPLIKYPAIAEPAKRSS